MSQGGCANVYKPLSAVFKVLIVAGSGVANASCRFLRLVRCWERDKPDVHTFGGAHPSKNPTDGAAHDRGGVKIGEGQTGQ